MRRMNEGRKIVNQKMSDPVIRAGFLVESKMTTYQKVDLRVNC